MTIKEFYQWVEENNIEDYELCYNGDAGGGSVKAVLSDIEINDKFKEVTIGRRLSNCMSGRFKMMPRISISEWLIKTLLKLTGFRQKTFL